MKRHWLATLAVAVAVALWARAAESATPCVKHAFVSARPDSADTGAISSSEWNDCHVIDDGAISLAKIAAAQANARLLGSGASGAGSPYVELSLGANLSIAGTVLNVASNAQLSVAKLINLTSNGLVRTSGDDGTLIIDTASYLTSAVTSVGLSGTTNQIAITGASPITGSGSWIVSIPSNAQLSVAKLLNLTSNGLVRTSGGDGTLSIDTASYLTSAVTSLAKSGSAALSGAVTFSEGANITLTQSGNDITVAATGGGVTDGDKGEIVISGGVWSLDVASVSGAKIADGGITSAAKLGDGIITTAKILDANVTTGKIADDAITNSKLGNMANGTIKCRNTAGTGDPEDCSAAQVAALIGVQTIADLTAKTTPVAADLIAIADSAASNAHKKTRVDELFNVVTVGTRMVLPVTKTTASGNLTLTTASKAYQFVDPNGSDRDVTLHSSPALGEAYVIKNIGGANSLVVKNSGGSTLATLTAGQSTTAIYDGAAWQTF